jgi:hypothetical protein
VLMEPPLDAGQEAEVAFIRSRPSAWVNLSLAKRLLMAFTLAV